MNLYYLHKLTDKNIKTLEHLLKNSRLLQHLWVEMIFNPTLCKECTKQIDKVEIKNAFTKALSWYLAYKWLFAKNPVLEELGSKGYIKPFPIRDEVYKRDYRTFLKGILHLL